MDNVFLRLYRRRAVKAYRAGDYAQALVAFQRTAVLNPGNADDLRWIISTCRRHANAWKDDDDGDRLGRLGIRMSATMSRMSAEAPPALDLGVGWTHRKASVNGG
jgi:hypothetical protein